MGGPSGPPGCNKSAAHLRARYVIQIAKAANRALATVRATTPTARWHLSRPRVCTVNAMERRKSRMRTVVAWRSWAWLGLVSALGCEGQIEAVAPPSDAF